MVELLLSLVQNGFYKLDIVKEVVYKFYDEILTLDNNELHCICYFACKRVE